MMKTNLNALREATIGTEATAVMWPPLPPGCPVTPLPKDLQRDTEVAFERAVESGEEIPAPGVEVAKLKNKVLKDVPLEYFQAVNLSYPGLRLVHCDPPVFVVDNFLSSEECDRLIELSEQEDLAMEVASPTFAGGLSTETRTSTTWFLKYKAVPEMVERTQALLASAT